MQKKDLKIGGYYVSNNTCEKIFKYTDPSGSENKYIIKEHKKLYQDCGGVIDLFPGTLVAPFTKATQEQIDHLDACIAADKYVEAPEKFKFEVGKWYNDIGTENYRKCNTASNTSCKYSEKIEHGKYEVYSGDAWWENSAIEVSLQDIQQYLPEGHPDRIDTIPEFIECVKNDFGISTITMGKVYKTIDKHTTKDCYGFINNQGNEDGYYRESFKPSTKEAYLAQHGKSEELTELPEKWCIHLPSQKIKDFIGDLDICNVKIKDVSGGYVNYDKLYTCAKTKDTIEITFDQFKKWVLKEDVKPIEKWSVGTYVVWTKEVITKCPKGTVDRIMSPSSSTDFFFTEMYGCVDSTREKDGAIKWFATKEEAEKFAETLIDKPKGIVPQDDKWYNIEDGYGEYYIARYNGGFHSCEAIYEGEYTLDNDIESSGEYRIIAEVPSNDPKITGPLLKYAKKKYPVGTKYLYRTTEIVKGSLQYYPSPPQITDGHGGSVYFRGEWSEIVSLPEKEKEESKSTHKFKVGDSVIVSNSGYYYPTHTKAIEYGCRDSYYKENRGPENGNVLTVHKQVIINNDTVGYVVTTGTIDYLISEKGLNEFTKESKLEEANRRFKVGMIINTSYYQNRRTLVKGDFPLKEENNGCIYTRTGRCSLYDKLTDKWATIISEEKDEESWYNEITGDLKNIERKTVTIKYNNKPSLNLILFDNEPVIFSKPNKVNSINAELLIIEE